MLPQDRLSTFQGSPRLLAMTSTTSSSTGAESGRIDEISDDTKHIFGLADNTTLDAPAAETADNPRSYDAASNEAKLRTYTSFAAAQGCDDCSLQPDTREGTSTGMQRTAAFQVNELLRRSHRPNECIAQWPYYLRWRRGGERIR
jgi:hypothetical protein